MDAWPRVGASARSLFLPLPRATILTLLGRDFVRIQKIREEDQNLYFNARSPWRWCEFAAHPRVMLYADRTGAELSDIRVRRLI